MTVPRRPNPGTAPSSASTTTTGPAAAPGRLSGLAEAGGLAHATTVAAGRRALVIAGPPGTGKSGLALRLMAMGARLVADDRTILTATPGGPPVASAPAATRGLIEARGLGLLRVDPAPPTPVAAVLDLALRETERLPPARTMRLAGADVALLHNAESAHFAAALMQYLEGGRADT